MKQGIEIIRISTARLDNVLHMRYHERMYEFVTGGTVDPVKIYVEADLLAEWRGLIDVLKQINRQSTASLQTMGMDEFELERDGWLGYLFQLIRAAQASLIPAEKEAGDRAARALAPYQGIQKESVERETGLIEGLLIDIRSEELAADVELLGLEKALTPLEASNNSYKQLAEERTDAHTLAQLPPTKEVRRQADAIMNRVFLLTEAAYIICKDEEDMAAIAQLAAGMNTRTEEIRTKYNQSQAQKHGAGSGLPSDDSTNDGTDGTGSGSETTPDSGETPGGSDSDTPDDGTTPGGSETPDSGDTGGNEGGGTPTPPPGDDDDEEVVG